MKSSPFSKPPGSLLTSPLELVIPMCPTIPGAERPSLFWVVLMGKQPKTGNSQVEKCSNRLYTIVVVNYYSNGDYYSTIIIDVTFLHPFDGHAFVARNTFPKPTQLLQYTECSPQSRSRPRPRANANISCVFDRPGLFNIVNDNQPHIHYVYILDMFSF